MNKEEIKHFKSMLRQGTLRHMNILLDGKFQNELLNIIKDYEKLQQENQKHKEVIDKIKEFIESKNNGVCVINGKEKEAFTFLLDFDKAREFIWELLDILKEVE